ncbi:MAG: DUF1963 domain-containing protein [Corynebacterium sp.]|nr:DUF1963 domain-containing protein [Corynebacterium sp.]
MGNSVQASGLGIEFEGAFQAAAGGVEKHIGIEYVFARLGWVSWGVASIMTMTTEVFQPTIGAEFAQYKDVLERNARRTIEIQLKGVPVDGGDIPAAVAANPAGSRVGGPALVTADYPWPVAPDGAHMFHLAQFNLTELPPLAGYPDSGVLQFFAAADDTYGLDYQEAGSRVRLIPAAQVDSGHLEWHNHEHEYEESPITGGYFEVTGQLYDQLPLSPDKELKGLHDSLPTDYDEPGFNALWDFLLNLPTTVLGPGWAFFTQWDPRPDDSDLQLLFHLDTFSDNGVEVMFGDVGVVNFFITPTDLANQHFENTFYHWDCY